MGIEHRLDKIIRKLQRPLTENEINVRLETTQMVVGQLREDPEWKNWITGAIIFGSTARHTAKTGSDVDLAIKTKQDFFFGLNFSFVTYKLRESIEKIQNELKAEEQTKQDLSQKALELSGKVGEAKQLVSRSEQLIKLNEKQLHELKEIMSQIKNHATII